MRTHFVLLISVLIFSLVSCNSNEEKPKSKIELTCMEPTLGDIDEDIDASEELWDFFSGHAL